MKLPINRRLNLLPILLTPFLLLSPIFLTGRALFWGTPLLQFVPWWEYAWKTLLAGHLPLWNPLVGMGAPLLANYQSALLYPPTWVYFILYLLGGLKLMAWGQALLVTFHLAWSGLGIALLIRRLGLGILAQVVAGLAFGLSSYLVARSWFFSINATVAWLPWVILCLTPDSKRRENTFISGRRFSMLAICLGMQLLAGHAQITWYTLLLTVPWVVFWTVRVQSDTNVFCCISRIALDLLRLMAAVLLAFGIAAVQLIPTAEYLLQSQRSGAVDYQLVMTYSFWPWRLLTLLLPGAFGSPVSGDYWGYANYWEDAIYIGLLPLLLAIGGLLAGIFNRKLFRSHSLEMNENHQQELIFPGSTSPRRLVWFLFIIFLIALVLALGKNTPIFPWLYLYIPSFDMFQAPARWMVWGVFSLSLLSGIGAEVWRRPVGWSLYWTRLVTMGTVAISLGAGLAWYKMGDISPSFISSTTIMGFLGLGIGILSLTAPPRSLIINEDNYSRLQVDQSNPKPEIAPISLWRKRLFQFKPPAPVEHSPKRPYPLFIWQWAVSLFIAIDLLVMNWGLVPAGDLSLYGPSPTARQVRSLADGGRLFISKYTEHWLKYVRFLRFDTFYLDEDWNNLRATLLANSNMLDDIASVNNFDPLTPARFANWIEMLDEASPESYRSLLPLMNVGVVEKLSNDKPDGVRFEKETGRWFYWAECSRVVKDPDEVCKLIVDGGIDFNREVILEESAEIPDDDCATQKSRTSKSASHFLEIMDTRNPNRIDMRTITETPAWLVISEVWYPGWQARLDGEPVSILRANYLFRAVHVPSGDHKLTFTYNPFSFWAGIVLTSMSLIIMFFVVRRHDPS